jgi:hypothetical protein
VVHMDISMGMVRWGLGRKVHKALLMKRRSGWVLMVVWPVCFGGVFVWVGHPHSHLLLSFYLFDDS